MVQSRENPPSVDPVFSGAATEQVTDRQTSLTPELESLSSGSEVEDPYYEALEEVGQTQNEGNGQPGLYDNESRDEQANKSPQLEQELPDHDDVEDGCAQHPQVGSVDADFIMVDYPTSTETDDKHTQPQLTVSKPVIGGSPPVGSSEEETSSCLLYTSPSPRDATLSRMPSSA